MKNRFNLNESEKKRIKGLHGIPLNEAPQQQLALPPELEQCINQKVSLYKDRELIGRLPRECFRIIGYEVSTKLLGKKAAQLAYPNWKTNELICMTEGIQAATQDDETFDMVLNKIDEIVDCLVEKGVEVDLESLTALREGEINEQVFDLSWDGIKNIPDWWGGVYTDLKTFLENEPAPETTDEAKESVSKLMSKIMDLVGVDNIEDLK